MAQKIVRVEQVAIDGTSWRYHLVLDKPEGQYRASLEFDHEPSDVELKDVCIKWMKGIKYIKRRDLEVD